MIRAFAVALVLSCFAVSPWAQAQPAPGTRGTTAAPKPAARKSAPKAKTSAKPPGPAESGPCQIGVIPVIGDQFVVQKVGLMVFGNDHAEVPINAWGLDDLAVARVRAAAAGAGVRKIAYAKGAFELMKIHPLTVSEPTGRLDCRRPTDHGKRQLRALYRR